MNAIKPPLFACGHVVATSRAIDALDAAGQTATELLSRHQAGDYGVVNEEDKKANDEAVRCEERVFSAYLLNDGVTKLWCITEADRSSTCLLLPEEY